MKKEEVFKLISDLSWDNSEEMQFQSIDKLKYIEDDYIKYLILPDNYKCWENASKVLLEIGFPRLNSYIDRLFNWFEDCNWPGCMNILSLLCRVEFKVLLPHIITYLKQSIINKDECKVYCIQTLLFMRKDSPYGNFLDELIDSDTYDWDHLFKKVNEL